MVHGSEITKFCLHNKWSTPYFATTSFPAAVLVEKTCECVECEQRLLSSVTDICALRDGISVPGLSVRLMQRLVDPRVVFFLPGRRHADLNAFFRKGIVGGLAICWRRLSVKGITRIRGGPHLARKCLGFDANRFRLSVQLCLSVQVCPPVNYQSTSVHVWDPFRFVALYAERMQTQCNCICIRFSVSIAETLHMQSKCKRDCKSFANPVFLRGKLLQMEREWENLSEAKRYGKCNCGRVCIPCN